MQKFKKYSGRITYSVFRMLLLIGLAFILMYPILFMITYAIRAHTDMQSPMVIWVPQNFTWDNFYRAITMMSFTEAVGVTLRVGVVSSLLQVVSCALVGYGLARFNFRGKFLVIGAVIITILVPPQLTILPTYLYFSFFDFFGLTRIIGIFTGEAHTIRLVNNPALFYIKAIFGVGIRSGLFIFIFAQFFRGLPKELEEAAYIDGSGVAKTFVTIMAPNSLPAFTTVFLFSVVWYWNDYFHTIMYSGRFRTVTISLVNLISRLAFEVGQGRMDMLQMGTILQAGALMSILPLLLIYVFFQRFFTESIERSGIVG